MILLMLLAGSAFAVENYIAISDYNILHINPDHVGYKVYTRSENCPAPCIEYSGQDLETHIIVDNVLVEDALLKDEKDARIAADKAAKELLEAQIKTLKNDIKTAKDSYKIMSKSEQDAIIEKLLNYIGGP